MTPKLYWVISSWNYSEVKKNTSEYTTPSHGIHGKLPDCIYNSSILMNCGFRKCNSFTESFRTWYLPTRSNKITVASCNLLDNYAITLKKTAKPGADVTGPRHWVKRPQSHHRILCTPKSKAEEISMSVLYFSAFRGHVWMLFHSVCRRDWATKKLESNLQLGSRSNFNESQSCLC